MSTPATHPQDWEPTYGIVYSEPRVYRTRRGHLLRTVHAMTVCGPYTYAQAGTILDLAAAAQDAGTGTEYSAAIVPWGDPLGVGSPWELDEQAVGA